MIFAIDPGSKKSAFVYLDEHDATIHDKGHWENETLSAEVGVADCPIVIEDMLARGKFTVGQPVIDTAKWIGRFWGDGVAQGRAVYFLGRHEIALNLCGRVAAKESAIRAAIIHRYGGQALAIGLKASPGPLHGVAYHEWSALAVALTWHDRRLA